MRSLILRKIAQGILPMALLFAIYLLWRGHNEPGGGFIAGLVTASAIVLEGLAFGAEWSRTQRARMLRPAFAVGLALAGATALIPVAFGDPLLTHYHAYLSIPDLDPIHLSTTLAFDIGVFLAVVGSAAVTLSVFAEPVR